MYVWLWLLLKSAALAASLPGLPLPFEPDAQGNWALGADLPSAYVEAGVQPGWVLRAVEGQPWRDAAAAQHQVAAGPARTIQLLFATPAGDTVLEAARPPLVYLEEVGLLPWPTGFVAPASGWTVSAAGAPRIRDAGGAPWELNPVTGAWAPAVADGQAKPIPGEVPPVWWTLSTARWAVDGGGAVRVGDAAWASAQLSNATRLRSFQGRSGDHLAVGGKDGVMVYVVGWPRGTTELPVCVAAVPESCLVAGRQIAAELGDHPGGREEAARQLGVACDAGVHRACLEAIALDDTSLAPRTNACIAGDVTACHAVVEARLAVEPERPSSGLLGLLEYACEVDASGTLGERLRRLEDVGEGCMQLSAAYDRGGAPDRALLALDQACVLGRAEGCEAATRRRQEAFALRTVRECEDPQVPLASACVQLGRLLQVGTVSATKLDDFQAMRRACQLGDEEGCVLLGDYVDRWGIENPRVLAAEQEILAACSGGDQHACLGGAHLLVRHDPRSKEYADALLTFARACDAGSASACVAGAQQRRIGQARRVEAPDQTTLWSKACERDSAPGCDGLGERLARSKNTWDDAYTAWTRACDIGEPHACTSLGALVEDAHPGPWPGEQPPDTYLTRGCENGDPEGCYRLAEDDLPRHGDPPDAAYVLLDRSCQGEFGLGCAALAAVHLDRKTSFDEEIAAKHLDVACDNGHYESCKVLGGMYLKGRGVERDRQRARELVQRYSVNARTRHLRFGPRLGFPSIAGGEAELVLPIPVGPALAVAGSGTFLPGAGGALMLIKGMDSPTDPPDYRYLDAGVRVYPNNKARGIYVMAAVHQLEASGGQLTEPMDRLGGSARLGLHNESGAFYTRIEIGLGEYGLIDLHDFDEDEAGVFPLIQPTIGFSFGFSVL